MGGETIFTDGQIFFSLSVAHLLRAAAITFIHFVLHLFTKYQEMKEDIHTTTFPFMLLCFFAGKQISTLVPCGFWLFLRIQRFGQVLLAGYD